MQTQINKLEFDKMRCMANDCFCLSFKVSSDLSQLCVNCNHQWPFHVLHRISMIVMTHSEQNENIVLSLTEEIMSMILFGCQAIAVQIKILLDRLLSIHQQANIIRMLHKFGWSFQDYSRGYMLMNESGIIRTHWSKCTSDSEILIIKQFLMFPETRPMAIIMMANYKEYISTNFIGPSNRPDILAAMSMCTYVPPEKFLQNHMYKSKLMNSNHFAGTLANSSFNSSMLFLNRMVNFIDNEDNRDKESTQTNYEKKDLNKKKRKTLNDASSNCSVDYIIQSNKSNQPDNLSDSESSQSSKCMSVNQNQTFNGDKPPISSSSVTINSFTRSKKRVLCTACKKTFCDKGALKIHYSAVHLREMHRCTIKGCNMWFSSRRSRNRHSSNPNPRLHLSHSNKKLPDNSVVVDDGTGRSIGKRLPIPNSILNPPIITTSNSLSTHDYDNYTYNDEANVRVDKTFNFQLFPKSRNRENEFTDKEYKNNIENIPNKSQTITENRDNNIKEPPKLFTINSVID